MRSLLNNRISNYQSLVAVLIVLLSMGKISAAELPSFADLVEQNAPTIVEIQTSRSVAARAPIGDQELEDLLRRLNPGEEPDLNIEGIPEMRQRGAVGSGFIISEDGLESIKPFF